MESSSCSYTNLHGVAQLAASWQEGAGIVCSNGESLFGARGMGLLTEAISDAQLESLQGFQMQLDMCVMRQQELARLPTYNHSYSNIQKVI